MTRWHNLAAVLRGVAVAIRDPRRLALLNLVLPEERSRRYETDVKRMLGGPPRTVPIERLLGSSGETVPAMAFLDDGSTVPDFLLLRTLVRRFSDARFFEVGTFRGESALAVSDLAAEVVTLSLPDEEMARRGNEASYISAHRTLSARETQIQHLVGDSWTMDMSSFHEWADVLFIDGDHSREGVANDTRRCWPIRRSDEAVVIWHDAFFTPLVPRWEVIAGIADGLPPAFRTGLVHVSNTLCVVWLPEAASLPTVVESYVPRIAFEVEVKAREWEFTRVSEQPRVELVR